MHIINLLPKTKQRELKYERVWHSFIAFFVLSMCSFGLVFGAQAAAKYYLQNEIVAVQQESEQLQQQVNQEDATGIRQQITVANNLINDYTNMGVNAPHWSKVIKAFAVLPPEGIRINSLQADATSKTVTIHGFSPTRELVIQLYNNILNDKDHFTKVDYPLENVAKATDVTFHFTFTIQDSLLR